LPPLLSVWYNTLHEWKGGILLDTLSIPQSDLRKLLGAASPDAALLYLFLLAGGTLDAAGRELRMDATRLETAAAALRQMGLLPERSGSVMRPDEPPRYTQADVERNLSDGGFSPLVGEVQRRLGRVLSTEELRTLLGIYDYLRLPPEVISILITYCISRAKARGVSRSPSLRTIEKEAYRWADAGIDTLEAAAAYMQAALERQSRIGRLRRVLQLDNRALTAPEERYLSSWLDMGFGEAEVQLAYEKTCLNTGGLKWPYLNSILRSWCEQGLLTVEQIRAGDHAPTAPRRTGRGRDANGTPGDYEREALQQLLQLEGKG
jgi:DnaD/phage-associated family protein